MQAPKAAPESLEQLLLTPKKRRIGPTSVSWLPCLILSGPGAQRKGSWRMGRTPDPWGLPAKTSTPERGPSLRPLFPERSEQANQGSGKKTLRSWRATFLRARRSFPSYHYASRIARFVGEHFLRCTAKHPNSNGKL